ncbi:hypothetical protein DICVIV_01606 [Dictyocaulus viviparus]|uniref:CNH domain-containing protein n=1 Tax=Dictyocaulus viviparus TaxID=29172 RepID=A0A0D8YC40_DICVI|nr:hypothetical protein DICVIV_01606 [Dictyocaulus viviparus]
MYEAYSANEVAMKLPLEITSLACQSRRGFDLDNLCKQFEKKAVLDINVSEDVDMLFCVSDGQISAHSLKDRHYPVIATLNKVKPVHCFTTWICKDSGQLYILVSSKRRLYLFKWVEKDFSEVRFDYNQSFADKPTTLRVFDNTLLLNCGREYLLIKLLRTGSGADESWTGDCRRLLEFHENAAILVMDDRKLLGFAHSDSLLFTDLCGQKTTTTDLRFTDVLLDIVYDSPYLVALLPKGQVEVRSISPPYLIQSMVLSKASLLSLGIPGCIFVSSSFDVWMLDVHSNIRKNVSFLVADKQFDLAMQIAEVSSAFTDENKVEIKRQAALNLFHRKRFEESFQLHAEIKTVVIQMVSDVITIIQMFPEFLPEKLQKNAAAFDLPANDKKRALLALGNYLSAVRSDLSKQLERCSREKFHHQQRYSENLRELRISLQVVDTALLKCYLQTRPSLVDSLLRLHNNSCFFEDAESILLAEHRLPSLFIFDPNSDPFFHGFTKTVTYLQTLGNTHLELIFKYACWVLDKDIECGLEIFIGEESDLARNLDRQAVFTFLRTNYVAAVIPYLEHLVYTWEETRQQFHDALAEHYIIRVKLLHQDYVHTFPDDENITRIGDDDGELGNMRRRLIKFLRYSLYYSPQAVLLQLSNCVFYEERALVLGRLKHHEQALTIYTAILNDFESAEEYCRIYYDQNDEINSKVYLFLFRAFVTPSDPVIAGVHEKDLPTPAPDILSAIRVLNKYADKIDTVYALRLIPADTLLCTLSKALHTVIQTTQEKASALELQRSISACGVESHKERLHHVLSQRIVIGNSSECCKCGKRIGNSAFVRYPADGRLAHFGCYNESADKNVL